MPPKSQTFRIESASGRRRVLESLSNRFSIEKAREPSRKTVYLDTFDWRLYRAGGTLSLDCSSPAPSLTWWSGADSTPETLQVECEPAFEWDLPEGPFRTRLATIIEMRRLLPVVKVSSSTESLLVLDFNRKTVARLRLETLRAGRPDAKTCSAAMPALLTVSGLKGYDEQFHSLIEFLAEELKLREKTQFRLQIALEAIHRTPADYRSKSDFELDSDMSADRALRSIFLKLLDTIELNRAGVLEDLDSEFLHDFRVSVRRTRAALTQLKGVLPARSVAKYKREFAWLGKVTGPTRDLDVYLLKMPAYRASLTREVRDDLEPLGAYIQVLQRQAQGALARSLATKRYERIVNDWRAFLEGAPSIDELEPPGADPIVDLARQRIWKAYRRVLKKGRAIHEDTPAEALHSLRIDCKKLRYLLEFFRVLFDPKDTNGLIKALKRLQDNLGDFNDYEVQQETLVSFARDMAEKGLAGAETLMAMGRLVEHLEFGQANERLRFHEQFDRFSAKRNRERFRRLFKPATAAS